MNSDERRAARRARRDAKRAANRAKRIERCTLEAVADLDNLYVSANDAASGVRWKASVQRYMGRVMPNIMRSRRDLLTGADFRRGFIEFDLFERGKLRHICSVHFSERVIQKSLSRHALAPAIWPTLTEGCAANVKGRGTEYAIKRMKRQLVAHRRKHGTEGYILQVDFSDYFANIDHDVCKRIIDRTIDDERIKKIMSDQIDAHGARGLGLGSEPNQILAVALPSPIDHLMLSLPGIIASGRYMDDSYCIALDKQTLWGALSRIEAICADLGIIINRKKTRVVKLSRGFVFLKKRFSYGEGGKVVVRPCRSSVTRQRRKLKKQAALVSQSVMTIEQVRQSYQSWRGGMKRIDAYETVRRMDALYKQLFG
ncbi:RNA-directed DNA polymerase [Collinsella ihumii]|uniref:RNA-directed DNA polymerase n=1 Tax=Collinsella ihumii TaxID=1720204 RepID=A0ABT7XHI8_9ACTN|nr:RNA-directed DNA polymerase [Collinsella ihumii]MDN0064880.1 RNA-directed DNA polymerase [Collinsella ihumii]